ncbi:MAG: hypothetical protein SGJ20_00350 [Planctomycetota bacterium]|nr:hypothetical protein [Planctomycetota bacterium]
MAVHNLVVDMFCKPTIVAYYLDSFKVAAVSEFGQDVERVTCTVESVFDSVLSLTIRHQHKYVTSVHILWSLLSVAPRTCEDIIGRLNQLAIVRRPLGTPRQQMMLEAAKAAGKEEFADEVQLVIHRGPLSLTTVLERLNCYLHSPFFPFDEDQLKHYLKQRHAVPEGDVAILAFCAHSLATQLPGGADASTHDAAPGAGEST